MGYEHWEDALGGGGSRQRQTHTHKHTHIVPRDTQGGWRQGQGLDAFVTHVCVAPPLIEVIGYEHREDAVGVGGAGNVEHTHTHTHTHAHTQCPP